MAANIHSFDSGSGPLFVFAVPGTPGDWRSAENTRHDLRRILRSDGMLETTPTRTPPPRQPSRIELLERCLAEIERRLGIRVGNGAQAG
jgi:hypothetical protein